MTNERFIETLKCLPKEAEIWINFGSDTYSLLHRVEFLVIDKIGKDNHKYMQIVLRGEESMIPTDIQKRIDSL